MSYSAIKKKKCKGNNCNKYPVLGMAGYCYQCCPAEIKEKLGTKHQAAMRRKKERLRMAAKLKALPENIKMLQDKGVVESKELQAWFFYHIHNSVKRCENCGADLSHYNEKDWRGSQDHIIEKSKQNGCPSVAAVLENHCVLGLWCCHSQKHTSNLNLSRMAVFPLLKERFKKFEHLIADAEKRKIPEIFYEEK